MTDDLYERYKEALRTGHVAVLRGSLEEALAAYQLAADTAPSRALPHTSLGGVYMRLGHLEDALTEFAAAVARAPHDEGALLGQAEALTAAGMRIDAAAALDHVAEIQEAAGRLPEAADTLRRAVELEEAPERIRRQRAILREIRFSAGDHAAEQLLARALRLRDEPAAGAVRPAAGPGYATGETAVEAPVEEPQPERSYRDFDADIEPAPEPAPAPAFSERQAIPWPAAEPAPRTRQPMPYSRAFEPFHAESEPEPEPVAAAPELEPELELEPVVAEAATPEPESEPEPERLRAPQLVALAAMAERPAIGVMESVPGPFAGNDHQPTGNELLTAAEAADQAGDATALRSLLLWTARAYAREGRFDAALDATHRLLQRAPSDVDAQLVLVELYVARSWDGLAAEKLKLLGKLAELNNDEETRKRLCAAATRAFPEDPTLEHLCA